MDLILDSATSVQILSIAIGIVFLVVAVVVFLFRPESVKLGLFKFSSWLTFGMIIATFVFLSTSFYFGSQNDFFARAICSSDGDFAPATIQCTNLSVEYDDADWFVDGELLASTDRQLVFEVDEAGSYEVVLRVSKRGLIRDDIARTSEIISVVNREDFERDIVSNFEFQTNTARSQVYQIEAPEGFGIDAQSVIVDFQRISGQVILVTQRVSNDTIEFEVSGAGRVDVSGFDVRSEPARARITVSFTAIRTLRSPL